jgi:hypothetical protein
MPEQYDSSDRQLIDPTIEGMREQALAFLEDNGYPPTDRYLQIVGMYFQMLPAHQDYFFADELDMYIRKQEIQEAAFFLINPKGYKQLKELEAKEAQEKTANEDQEPGVSGAAEQVVSTPQE